jgi:hypothetical protein
MIVVAAVDAGNISFYRFGQGAFEEWTMAWVNRLLVENGVSSVEPLFWKSVTCYVVAKTSLLQHHYKPTDEW